MITSCPFYSNRNLLVALLASVVLAQTVSAARLFYSDQPSGSPGSIMSVALDGTDQKTLLTVSNSSDLRGVAWHRGSNLVYFLDNGAAKAIFSMSPDGNNLRQVLPVSATLLNSDLEIDEGGGQLYWAENNPTTTGNGYIRRANLDGSNPEAAVTTAAGPYTAPYFMFLDRAGGFIYWGVASEGSTSSTFRRATFAGTIDPDFALTSPTRTRDLAVDSTTGIIYWCDRQMGSLYKRAVTGTVNQLVISGMNAPHGIAIDPEAGKVYWADTGQRGSGAGLSSRRVARCNFDGSEFEALSIYAATSEPWDIALDLSSPTYADWRARFFATNFPAAGPADDADGDGAPNLLEYALGTHPRLAASLPRLTPATGGLQFTRRRGSNLEYRVEVATDLTVWRHNQDGSGLQWTTEISATPRNEDYETVTIRGGTALMEASGVFFRVRVVAPE